jgi:hypothetical protein
VRVAAMKGSECNNTMYGELVFMGVVEVCIACLLAYGTCFLDETALSQAVRQHNIMQAVSGHSGWFFLW